MKKTIALFFLSIVMGMVMNMSNEIKVNAEGTYYTLAVYTTTTAFYQSAANIEQETQSVYFALGKDGKEYKVLNNNGGVVFAKQGSGRLVRPRIFREDGRFVIRALDNNGSNVHVFNSEDGVVFIEQPMVNDKSLINDNGVLDASVVKGFPEDSGISLGNEIEISEEEYRYINDKLGKVINTGLAQVEGLTVHTVDNVTESLIAEKIPTVNAVYSDGSTQEFGIDWSGALANVDLKTPGKYTVKGKVIQKRYLNKLKELNNSRLPEDDPDNYAPEFPTNYDPDTNTVYYDSTKFVEGMADPEIYWDEITGYYYMTGSYFPQPGDEIDSSDHTNQYDRVTLRRGRTLEELQTRQGNQVTIWKAGNQKWYDGPSDTTGGNGYRNIWAPEIHRVGYVNESDPGWWVVYFTESHSTDAYNIYNHCLVLPGDKDPYDTALSSGIQASEWTDYKMQASQDHVSEPVGGRSVEPFEASFCLDMTYFKDKVNGQSYVIWAAKPVGNSDLFIAKVSEKEPWQLISGCIRLTTPEYGWEKIRYAVNEGPTVLQRNGKIFMCFSNSGTGSEYCIGMMTADAGDDLLDITNWTKNPFPLLTSRDVNGEEGPGHNSFTVDEDGNAIFVYHARPTSHNYRMCAYDEETGKSQYNSEPLADPCRHARLKRVHWAYDGTPILRMTYDDELKEEYNYVTADITVLPVNTADNNNSGIGQAGNAYYSGNNTGIGQNIPASSAGIDSSIGSNNNDPSLKDKIATINISGKSKLKIGKKTSYRIVFKGNNTKKLKEKKIKWSVKKGKKYIRLDKKTGTKIKITAKKAGKAVITVKYGSYKAQKKITVR